MPRTPRFGQRRRGGQITNNLWHRWQIRRNAKRDGRVGVPGDDDPRPSAYESQLLARTDQHLSHVLDLYTTAIQHLEARVKGFFERLRDDTNSFLDHAGRYAKRKTELGRDVLIHVSPGRYLLFMVLISIGEFVFNSQVFAVFEEAPLMTVLMALAVAVVVPLISHAMGMWIKQWPKPTWRTAVLVVVTASVVIVGFYEMNVVRLSYLAEQNPELGRRTADLRYVFFFLNLLIFLGATLLSYLSHDADQDFWHLYLRVQGLSQRLERTDAQIEHDLGEIEFLQQREHSELEQIRALMRELIGMYRQENILARGGKRPKSMEEEPKFKEVTRAVESQILPKPEEIEAVRALRRPLMHEVLAKITPRLAGATTGQHGTTPVS